MMRDMMLSGVRKRRAARALQRQLEYQSRKAQAVRGRETFMLATMTEASRRVRGGLEQVHEITRDMRVLEVGSGAHGLIFCFDTEHGYGIDPLAVEYAALFPWQRRARTIAAFGERLPFRDGSFDVVLCDNVVDHAESPDAIVNEIVRVVRPGGLLYFTVNFHHPMYHLVSLLHGAWNAAGFPFEITPFADHTVHLTRRAAKRLLESKALRMVRSSADIAGAKKNARQSAARHAGDLLKRVFFKNALFEAVAVRAPEPAGR